MIFRPLASRLLPSQRPEPPTEKRRKERPGVEESPMTDRIRSGTASTCNPTSEVWEREEGDLSEDRSAAPHRRCRFVRRSPREDFARPQGTRGGRDGFPDAVLDCSHLSRRYTSTATPLSPAFVPVARSRLRGGFTAPTRDSSTARCVGPIPRAGSVRAGVFPPGPSHSPYLLRGDLESEVGCRRMGVDRHRRLRVRGFVPQRPPLLYVGEGRSFHRSRNRRVRSRHILYAGRGGNVTEESEGGERYCRESILTRVSEPGIGRTLDLP